MSKVFFTFFPLHFRPLTFMGSQTKKVLLTPLMPSARPFRVSNHDRSSRRGVMASSLKELISKGSKYAPACQQPKKSGIARVTFDLYKLNPKDFIGCLNVKATMYEMYSVSYDIRCTGVKALVRSLLRFLSYAAQVTGQFLIYTGTYMLRVLGDAEQPSLRSHSRGQYTCG
ncbi:Cell death activator CIDE-A [Tupaia chinensis]|uniref:Cell death activator CIDE-A n=1 Tax=Tupaia chinensis TaxID=246437 RepID=L8YCR2_TUPCH|nr:Cell death activator CIDE-A [Tupaia chinensis]